MSARGWEGALYSQAGGAVCGPPGDHDNVSVGSRSSNSYTLPSLISLSYHPSFQPYSILHQPPQRSIT
jgi:hypothetical protein